MMGAIRYTIKLKVVSMSFSRNAPTIQPIVNMTPEVVNENINAIAPKKPPNVNRKTMLDGIRPSSANPLSTALIMILAMIPVATSPKPFWKSFIMNLIPSQIVTHKGFVENITKV